jgi:hypothetical protein
MANQKNSLAEFMQGSLTLIENAGSDPAIAAAVAEYGYDAARLAQGRRLWAEVDALAKKQTADYAGRHGATQDFGKAWEVANAAYMKTLKVARVVFGDDARAISALKLYGPRKLSLAGWLAQATTLYANLASDTRLVEGLRRFGYSPEKLAAESALVEKVRLVSQTQTQGNGAAQSATAARDGKLRDLDAWVSDFRTICRVAFYENPQELEKLGMMALNGRRRGTKKDAAMASTNVSAKVGLT